jgi:hypothetical protein
MAARTSGSKSLFKVGTISQFDMILRLGDSATMSNSQGYLFA